MSSCQDSVEDEDSIPPPAYEEIKHAEREAINDEVCESEEFWDESLRYDVTQDDDANSESTHITGYSVGVGQLSKEFPTSTKINHSATPTNLVVNPQTSTESKVDTLENGKATSIAAVDIGNKLKLSIDKQSVLAVSALKLDDSRSSTPTNDKTSREYKALQKSFIESKVLAEFVSETDRSRKSRKVPLKSDDSNMNGDSQKYQICRARSKSCTKTDPPVISPNSSAPKRWPSDGKLNNKRENMRSQNTEFVQKQMKFLNRVNHDQTNEEVMFETSDGEQSLNESCKTTGSLKLKDDCWQPPPKRGSDSYCWKCRKCADLIACSKCPRSFHLKCLKLSQHLPVPDKSWLCPECVILENCINGSKKSKKENLPIDLLNQLLLFALKRMKEVKGHERLLDVPDPITCPSYHLYVVNPVTLNSIQAKIERKEFRCTEEFVLEAKWIQHIVQTYSVYTNKDITLARALLKVCRQEATEIETCSECYLNANTRKDWFLDVCIKPHILLWAKLKGFPYWPAKGMSFGPNSLLNVRFFGDHDRAFVPVKDCYLYSAVDPNQYTGRRSFRSGIADCIKEIDAHIAKIRAVVGDFKYAEPKTLYDPHNEMKQLEAMMPGVTEYMKRQQAIQKPPLTLKIIKTAGNNLSIIKKTDSGTDSDQSNQGVDRSRQSLLKSEDQIQTKKDNKLDGESMDQSVNPSIILKPLTSPKTYANKSNYEVVAKPKDEFNSSKINSVILKRKSDVSYPLQNIKKQKSSEESLPTGVSMDDVLSSSILPENQDHKSEELKDDLKIKSSKRKRSSRSSELLAANASVSKDIDKLAPKVGPQNIEEELQKPQLAQPNSLEPQEKMRKQHEETTIDQAQKEHATDPQQLKQQEEKQQQQNKQQHQQEKNKHEQQEKQKQQHKQKQQQQGQQQQPSTHQQQQHQQLQKQQQQQQKQPEQSEQQTHQLQQQQQLKLRQQQQILQQQKQIIQQEKQQLQLQIQKQRQEQQQQHQQQLRSLRQQQQQQQKKQHDRNLLAQQKKVQQKPGQQQQQQQQKQQTTQLTLQHLQSQKSEEIANKSNKERCDSPSESMSKLVQNRQGVTIKKIARNQSGVITYIVNEEKSPKRPNTCDKTPPQSAAATLPSQTIQQQQQTYLSSPQSANASTSPPKPISTLSNSNSKPKTFVPLIERYVAPKGLIPFEDIKLENFDEELLTPTKTTSVETAPAPTVSSSTSPVQTLSSSSSVTSPATAKTSQNGSDPLLITLDPDSVKHEVLSDDESSFVTNLSLNQSLVSVVAGQQSQTMVASNENTVNNTNNNQTIIEAPRIVGETMIKRIVVRSLESLTMQPPKVQISSIQNTPTTSLTINLTSATATQSKNKQTARARKSFPNQGPNQSSTMLPPDVSRSLTTKNHMVYIPGDSQKSPIPIKTAVSKTFAQPLVAKVASTVVSTSNTTPCQTMISISPVTTTISTSSTVTLPSPIAIPLPAPPVSLNSNAVSTVAPTINLINLTTTTATTTSTAVTNSINHSIQNTTSPTQQNSSETTQNENEIDNQQREADGHILSGIVAPNLAAAITDTIVCGPPRMTHKPSGALRSNGNYGFNSNAGPVSRTLVESAHKITDFFISVMQDTVSDMADLDILPAKVAELQMELETKTAEYEKRLFELKQNTDTMLCEMKKSMEAERVRIIAETRKQCEAERVRIIAETRKQCEIERIHAVEQTKKKQWCTHCGREANSYCCWNTAYCDANCQSIDWNRHKLNCCQVNQNLNTDAHGPGVLYSSPIVLSTVSTITTPTIQTSTPGNMPIQPLHHYQTTKSSVSTTETTNETPNATKNGTSSYNASIACPPATIDLAYKSKEMLKLPPNTFLRAIQPNNQISNSPVHRLHIPLPINTSATAGGPPFTLVNTEGNWHLFGTLSTPNVMASSAQMQAYQNPSQCVANATVTANLSSDCKEVQSVTVRQNQL